MMNSCANDWDIGPVSRCRRFDFTLAWESLILSVVPSALIILLGLWRLNSIRRQAFQLPTLARMSVKAKIVTAVKLCTSLGLLFCNIAILATSPRGEKVTPTLHAATSLALATSALTIVLSWEEHFRTTASSPLLPIYLLTTLLCDAARVRTFALQGETKSRFFAAFCASVALRFLFFVGENVEKGWMVKEKRAGGKALSPDATASFMSNIFFAWATPLLLRGARTQLNHENMDSLSDDLDSTTFWPAGNAQWEKEVARGTKNPLAWTLLRAYPSAVLAPVLPCIIYSLATVSTPQLINDAVQFLESYTDEGAVPEPVENGWGLAAAFFLVYAVYGVAYSWWFMACNKGSTKIRGFLMEELYRKSLRIHVEVAKKTGGGTAGAMMSVETEKIMLRFVNLYDPLNTLIIVTLGLVILWDQVGPSFVAAIIAVAILAAITPTISSKVGPTQVAWRKLTEKRTTLTNSVLQNIVSVKLMAYTAPLGKKIFEMRNKEMVACTKFWFQMCKIGIHGNISTNFMMFLTIGTYSVVSIIDPKTPPLTTARMFTTIAALSTISQPIHGLGMSYASVLSAWTAVKKIEEFLLSEEKGSASLAGDYKSSGNIVFRDASFGRADTVLLREITTTIPEGKKTFITGRVGSGKTTLLHACLGEVDLLSGGCLVPRCQTAYCSQDAWLRSETIRNAIVFASDFDETWYWKVVRAMCLDVDFAELPDGDGAMTTNLSGGQRQRVALARAVYAKPHRLLLDDVFSALDANTEDAVFRALFDSSAGLLLQTTVIMATNNIPRLQYCDHLIVIAAGAIDQQGTYTDIASRSGTTRDLVQEFSTTRRSPDAEPTTLPSDSEKGAKPKDTKGPRSDESKRVGTGWGPYRFFFAAMGAPRVLIAVALGATSSALPVVTKVYLNYWSTAVKTDPRGPLRRFFGGYVALELGYVLLFALAEYYNFCVASPIASHNVHSKLLTSVLGAPISKLTKDSGGKLLNRFSSDIFVLDYGLPFALNNTYFLFCSVLGSVLVIIVSSPWMALIICTVAALFFVMQQFYVKTSQQLRRLDLGAKSPLYGLLNDVVSADGLRTVRAFRSEQHFTALNSTLVAASQQPFYLLSVSRRWLNAFINWSIALINTCLVLLAVSFRHSTSAGIFAVALVQVTMLPTLLNFFLLWWVQTELGVVAIERIKELSDVPSEESEAASGPVPDDKALLRVWPRQGGIQFNNVTARYGLDSDPVLKGVSFKISAGERVGIVGRTGSGKTTTFASIFRMVNIDGDGRLLIDGKNTADLSLETLRSGITLIPQDPLLLDMSIRDNLDLEGEASDDQIWSALEKVSMKTVIEALPEKLEELITGSGHFSRGQKQLLALARALLRDRQIICMDEATSSLDFETDQVVQRTLRSSFGKATILTIAHRVGTVQDYDRILVLDGGVIVEEGTPADLLLRPDGLFRRLVNGVESST